MSKQLNTSTHTAYLLHVDTAEKPGYTTLINAALMKCYGMQLGVQFTRRDDGILVQIPNNRLDLASKIRDATNDYVQKHWKRGKVTMNLYSSPSDSSRLKELEKLVESLRSQVDSKDNEVTSVREQLQSVQGDLAAAEELLNLDSDRLALYKKRAGLETIPETSKQKKAPRRIQTSVHIRTYNNQQELLKRYKKQADELSDRVSELEDSMTLKDASHKRELSRYSGLEKLNESLDEENQDYRRNIITARAALERIKTALKEDMPVSKLNEYLTSQQTIIDGILSNLIVPNGKRYTSEGVKDISKRRSKSRYAIPIKDAINEAVSNGHITSSSIVRYCVDAFGMKTPSIYTQLKRIIEDPNSKIVKSGELYRLR